MLRVMVPALAWVGWGVVAWGAWVGVAPAEVLVDCLGRYCHKASREQVLFAHGAISALGVACCYVGCFF
ncbi:hypothetical protein U1Q18_002494 [Sarracenia purpurea var. burkii]